ncbi:MAG: c-type cytochrome, partial [Phycisphaerae bacterium]
AREMFDSAEIQCISCHIRGGILPEGDKANWGPDLARAPQRLRPEWVVRWLEGPQLLQPGTMMPTFEDFTDADRAAMKDFLMNFEYFYAGRDDVAEAGSSRAGQMDRAQSERSAFGRDSAWPRD